jgi:HSP20 family protein
MFDDITPFVSSQAPLINASETDDEYQLEVLAPKLEADDLKIEMEDNMLHLSTEKKWESASDDTLRQEYKFSYTDRSFKLPEDADGEQITAKNEKGVIMIHIPKKIEVQKPSRKVIEIQ